MDQPLFLRMAPEYRRIGIYLLIGYAVLVGTIIGLQHFGLGQGWGHCLIVALILVVPMLGGALLVFRQLLRIDREGIWRRRFVRWDCWSWEALAGGQIRPDGMNSYVYPAKPWWNSSLSLDFLAQADREALGRLIREVWQPPPLPAVPAEMTVRYGLRSYVQLTPGGIRVRKGKHGVSRLYAWSDVQQVQITRLDHSRRDFVQLTILLPNATTIDIYRNYPVASGPEAEILPQYLRKYVSAERLQVTARFGPPQSAEEATRRLAALERQEQQFHRGRRACLLMSMVLLGLFVGLLISDPPLRDWDFARFFGQLALVVLIALCCVSTSWFLRDKEKKYFRERREVLLRSR